MSGSGSGTGPADSLEVSVQGRKLGTIDPSNFNLVFPFFIFFV